MTALGLQHGYTRRSTGVQQACATTPQNGLICGASRASTPVLSPARAFLAVTPTRNYTPAPVLHAVRPCPAGPAPHGCRRLTSTLAGPVPGLTAAPTQACALVRPGWTPGRPLTVTLPAGGLPCGSFGLRRAGRPANAQLETLNPHWEPVMNHWKTRAGCAPEPAGAANTLPERRPARPEPRWGRTPEESRSAGRARVWSLGPAWRWQRAGAPAYPSASGRTPAGRAARTFEGPSAG